MFLLQMFFPKSEVTFLLLGIIYFGVFFFSNIATKCKNFFYGNTFSFVVFVVFKGKLFSLKCVIKLGNILFWEWKELFGLHIANWFFFWLNLTPVLSHHLCHIDRHRWKMFLTRVYVTITLCTLIWVCPNLKVKLKPPANTIPVLSY